MTVGAWAERVAVPTEFLAELPDEISFEQAATLPVAGLTALRALEIGGYIVGKRVLITGASGGVGRFAIQLAKLAGAHVTAVARRTEGLAELGADEVLPELSASGDTFDVILDAIGGPVLGAALQRVAPRGSVISFGATVTEPVSFPTRELFSRAPGAQLHGLYIFDELEHTRSAPADLRRLADLVAPAGWTRRSTSRRRGPRRPAPSRRCWTAAWPARPCSRSTDPVAAHRSDERALTAAPGPCTASGAVSIFT